jgi:hypothetical protein
LVLLDLLDDVCGFDTFAVVDEFSAFDEVVVSVGDECKIFQVYTWETLDDCGG